jgi:hypothetical protein
VRVVPVEYRYRTRVDDPSPVKTAILRLGVRPAEDVRRAPAHPDAQDS